MAVIYKKKWKHDGHNYIQRKKGTGFREDVEKLKIGGKQEIFCYYSYITNSSLLNDTESTILMNRRIYRLINIGVEKQFWFLVHYFKESKDSSSTTMSVSESNDEFLSRQLNSNTFFQIKSSEEAKKDFSNEQPTQLYNAINQQSGENDDIISNNNNNHNNYIDQSGQDCFFNDLNLIFDKDQDNQFQNINFSQDHLDINNNGQHINNNIINTNMQHQNSNQLPSQAIILNGHRISEKISEEPFSPLLQQQSQQPPDQDKVNSLLFQELKQQAQNKDFKDQDLVSRINELEERLQKLECKQKNNQGLMEEQKNYQKIKITEYSPEWDSCSGGSKIVVCFLPALELNNKKADNINNNFDEVQLYFGDTPVSAHCIQAGVLKAQIPPHNKGLVKLSIFINNQRIDDVMDKPSFFEYKKNQNQKRKKSSKNFLDDENGHYKSELKVRIIDKLNNFQSFMQQQGLNNQQQNSGGGNSLNPQQEQINANERNQNNEQQSRNSNNSNMEELNIVIEQIKQDVDNLNQDTYKILFEKLLLQAEKITTKQNIKKWLDSIDEYGFGLIHYLSILGYEQIILIMIKYDCNLVLPSHETVTPIEIAIAMNHEKVVELLLKSQVFTAKDIEGYNILSKNKEKDSDLSQFNVQTIFQNRNVLDMLIREVTLHDSINSSSLADQFSWNDQDEQEDHNYLNLDEIYGEDWSNQIENFQFFDAEEDKDPEDQKKTIHQQKLKGGHKYLRNYDRKKSNLAKKRDMNVDLNQKGEIYQSADNQNHIKLIQKNVRMWLLRRQYLDIKYATRILQHHLRQKFLAKKQLNPVCKSMIKNKVKDWLNIKY